MQYLNQTEVAEMNTEWTLLPQLFDRPISSRRVSGYFFLLLFIEIPVLYANRADPDQTTRSAASGLHCLAM